MCGNNNNNNNNYPVDQSSTSNDEQHTSTHQSGENVKCLPMPYFILPFSGVTFFLLCFVSVSSLFNESATLVRSIVSR